MKGKGYQQKHPYLAQLFYIFKYLIFGGEGTP